MPIQCDTPHDSVQCTLLLHLDKHVVKQASGDLWLVVLASVCVLSLREQHMIARACCLVGDDAPEIQNVVRDSEAAGHHYHDEPAQGGIAAPILLVEKTHPMVLAQWVHRC